MRPQPQPAPPLAERRKPGLSETLPHEKHPNICQACGSGPREDRQHEQWIECDEWDRPTTTIVVLCEPCARRVIEAHPKLYRQLPRNAPTFGAMQICVDCRHRVGTRCGVPKEANPVVEIEPPVHAFVRPGGYRQLWLKPATNCTQWSPRSER